MGGRGRGIDEGRPVGGAEGRRERCERVDGRRRDGATVEWWGRGGGACRQPCSMIPVAFGGRTGLRRNSRPGEVVYAGPYILRRRSFDAVVSGEGGVKVHGQGRQQIPGQAVLQHLQSHGKTSLNTG